ncbi:MAG: HPr family phosphocarrier protein [Alphaproteobacteria bacterium GM7ARS4]|nr:HPr family phosphocarrier protein [Alphaproteobacteria bacterium GM7ARS4]
MPSVSKKLTITNKLGLHARAATKFVHIAMAHHAKVRVYRGTLCANGRSILGLMMLAATQGSVIHIHAQGEDAQDVLQSLTRLIHDKFGEEE